MKKFITKKKLLVLIIIIAILLVAELVKFIMLEIKASSGSEVVLHYGYYYPHNSPTIDEKWNINGKFLDEEGNIYSYKIPRYTISMIFNWLQPYEIYDIDTKLLNKYRTEKVYTIENEELTEIVDNIKQYYDLSYRELLFVRHPHESTYYAFVVILDGEERFMHKNRNDMYISQENINVLDILNKYDFFK